MKLEATWIMSNIGFGSEADILAMFDQQYGVLTQINKIIDGGDLQLIDQCIWVCANAAGES
jgi:hypothetical protein